MLEAHVKIVGTRPFLFNHFGPEALPLEKGERTGVAGNDPEEWRKRYLVTKEGQLYIEQTYVFASLKAGAKYTKKGRGSLQTSLAATLQVLDDRVLIDRFMPKDGDPPINDYDADLYIDRRGCVNPSTRARNIRYRVAANSGWHMEFDIIWDQSIINRNEMEAICIDAGKLSGIGDGRTIGMGRYKIESFEIKE